MNYLRTAAFVIAGLLAAPAWGTLQAPTILLAPATITGFATSTLTITLQNNAPGNPNNIAFNFVYPANVFNASTPSAATTCTNGTVSATGLGNTLSLSGARISGNNSCTVTVAITSCNQGIYSIGGFGVTSTSGNPTAGTANLTVSTSSPALAATSTVTSSPGSVPADDSTLSTITVTARNACGTGATNKSISLAQGAGNSTIAPASAPTDANGVAAFTVRNGFAETVTYTATETVDSVVITQTASVTFNALNAPTVSKIFSPGTINIGDVGTLTVTINNPNNGTLTGLTFTDTYPGGLVNAGTPALSNSCGGLATAAPGGNQLALSGGVLSGMSSCSVIVSVTAAGAGSYPNSTGPVTSNNALAGAASGTLLVVTAVTNFNVVEQGANAVTGRIFTKVAGENYVVDIVALDASNAVVPAFIGTVTAELVDASGGGACAALPLVKTLAAQTFIAGDNGRHALSAGQFEANAHRNLRFRIKYPVASPTVTACSSDAFANRPKQFVSVLARDQDRASAGTARTLDNIADPGTGNVHNAGRAFRLDATAQNGAGAPATTTNYAPDPGQPVALLSDCGAAAACLAVPGTLSTGAWSATNGVITSITASYNDVGAFNLELEDQTYASVDAGDGTANAVRYIRSAAPLTVGRFVPDHFTVDAGSTITPRSDIAGCSASVFTYMDERMNLALTLSARAFGGAVTPGYSGATLGALVLTNPASYGFGAIDTAAPTPLTPRVDGSLVSGVTATWSVGTTGVITAPVSITRAAAPDGPYAALRIGVAPTDPDGVALSAADLNLDADNDATPERRQVGAATAVRFGRLRLQNAYGPESVGLQLPLQAQHWNGSSFALNADDSCSTLNREHIALSGYTLNLNACETAVSQASVTLSGGQATLTLAAAGAGNAGTVLLTPVLGALGAERYCPAQGGGDAAASSAARAYLQGKWTGATWDENPSARATFGLYGSQPKNFIFFRENY